MSLDTFDLAAIEGFTREFEQLFYGDGAGTMTEYYTADAQIMADGMRPIRGHAAIGEFWRTAIARATAAGARRTIEMHEWSSSGDLGYVLCTVTVDLGATAVAVWDATIWRRDDDGRWRIAVDISTPLPAQA
ncbi:YybH family protein [Actinoplanes subtropicus]|uniref:YybH family protein n=1 Tax=Actinoplanes subtropicus TaxID=543632 RepID=UPI0004C39936|nr:nuclear transport factor 2 family protein [Actinoplanes subtropicus]